MRTEVDLLAELTEVRQEALNLMNSVDSYDKLDHAKLKELAKKEKAIILLMHEEKGATVTEKIKS